MGLLVGALAVLAAWVTRRLAPPAHIRDGVRLPVDMVSQHSAVSAHHGSVGSGMTPPSSVSDAPLPHFAGAGFLALHVLGIALMVGVPVIRRLLDRFRLSRRTFVAQLMFAGLTALAVEIAVVLSAWVGYGDRLGLRAAFVGGVQAAQYGFAAALVVVVIFGVPLIRTEGEITT
ncbi:MAG: hypothetical protein ACJ72N_02580 [Labedaea sp.]